MRKLKTAKQVREEIIRAYSMVTKELAGGAAEFSVLGEKCYEEKQCLDIIKSNEKELDRMITKYFDVDGVIRDPAGNIYISREMAFESIRDGCYNSRKRQFTDKIERERY